MPNVQSRREFKLFIGVLESHIHFSFLLDLDPLQEVDRCVNTPSCRGSKRKETFSPPCCWRVWCSKINDPQPGFCENSFCETSGPEQYLIDQEENYLNRCASVGYVKSRPNFGQGNAREGENSHFLLVGGSLSRSDTLSWHFELQHLSHMPVQFQVALKFLQCTMIFLRRPFHKKSWKENLRKFFTWAFH